MKDFFISYSKADRAWAVWIAWHLEEEGYTTVIQDWDFRPGSSFPINMDNAAREAGRTIAVLSPDYLDSVYTKPEWAARFVEDPDGGKRRLIPVCVRQIELKGLFQQIVCINLWELDEEHAMKELLKGVNDARPKPKTRPGYPGSHYRKQNAADPSRPDFPREMPLNAARLPAESFNKESLIPKMCDRSRQDSTFNTFCRANLKQHFGAPQFYFVLGEIADCHASLIERLIGTRIAPLVEQIWGNEKGALDFKNPKWFYDGRLTDLKQQLLGELFSKLASDYIDDDYSADALCRKLTSSKRPLYVVQHDIHSTRWSSQTRDLLKWYLNYWSEVQASGGPQFIIFFCITFPETGSEPKWKQLLMANKLEKKRIEKQLMEIHNCRPATCPCLILEELSPIRREEVREWFSSYSIYRWEKMQLDAIENIFQKDKHKNMAHVEYELQRILEAREKEILSKRGYL